jgi:hypothetical protein
LPERSPTPAAQAASTRDRAMPRLRRRMLAVEWLASCAVGSPRVVAARSDRCLH